MRCSLSLKNVREMCLGWRGRGCSWPVADLCHCSYSSDYSQRQLSSFCSYFSVIGGERLRHPSPAWREARSVGRSQPFRLCARTSRLCGAVWLERGYQGTRCRFWKRFHFPPHFNFTSPSFPYNPTQMKSPPPPQVNSPPDEDGGSCRSVVCSPIPPPPQGLSVIFLFAEVRFSRKNGGARNPQSAARARFRS
jgi:hypothetical protein